MNNIWNELSEESKEFMRSQYDFHKKSKELSKENTTIMYYLEELFGEENLSPKLLIKTWEDYEKTLSKSHIDDIKETYGAICLLPFMNMGCDPVVKKMIAAHEIAILIKLGYGGIITDEEWADSSLAKHTIWYDSIDRKFCKHCSCREKTFLAFHTAEQRDEFLRNNESLCKDYYMIN